MLAILYTLAVATLIAAISLAAQKLAARIARGDSTWAMMLVALRGAKLPEKNL